MDHPVLEIVRFTTRPGIDVAGFLADAARMDGWLEGQPGFIRRRLGQADTGIWIDCIEWRSMSEAHAAAEGLMAEPSAKPFLSAIDGGSVVMTHLDIRHAA
ncbi:hypothetical protein GCM10011505_20470 [Tistrella bauzanensis]|uniref:ABM domain-containing protein n=1 Tax=Tistrella bauzanensis TaxID=657419 RepID=A0ABQ1IGT3_9PROT|nr:hypothetical protein [Tistrella bauzanensis]GGB38795.1 hypothetical protein GCM10011505_20470 [Tistrella bauzanensis]